MAKKRKPEDAWMPPRVYKHKMRGSFVSYIFKPQWTTKSITLCNADAERSEVWKAYEAACKLMPSEDKAYILDFLTKEYLDSKAFQKLAPRTQRDRIIELGRFNKVFGKMEPDNIVSKYVRQYMDKRGSQSETQANHELASASVLFAWGYERGKCSGNPCKGIKKFQLKARDRYITDIEYDAFLDCAEERLRAAIEISYLCAARQGDVLNLTWSQISDEGIYIRQGKTGKKQIKGWTEKLLEVINAAKSFQGKVGSIYVINKKGGGRLTQSGLHSAWERALEKMKENYKHINTDFTFHDIKAKSISDFEGTLAEKQQFSGHKTLSQVNTYDRKVIVVPSLNREKRKG